MAPIPMYLFHPIKHLFAALFLVVFAVQAQADDIALTVEIAAADGPVANDYSMEALEAMELTTIQTENDFVDGVNEFKGPLLRDVVAHTNEGELDEYEVVVLTAANDYSVEVPWEDFIRFDVILATTMGGAPLSRRDKGPIWVIYPMSDYELLQDVEYNGRLVWQLRKMEIR